MAIDTPPDDFNSPSSMPPPYQPRPRSSPRWPWLAVPVVIAAAVPASAWIIGQRVEAGYAARMAQAAQDMPVLAKAKVEYHRHLFDATRVTTVDLNAMYGGCFPHDAGSTPPPLVFSVIEHIQHGPFPGLTSFGAARVTYDARINGQPLASYFGRPLGGPDGPVLKLTGRLPHLVTVYGFGGGAATTLKGRASSLTATLASKADADADPASPPHPTAVTLAWQALDGRAGLNGAGDHLRLRLDFDGFTVNASTLRVTMGRLAYKADHHKNTVAGWWLPSGPSSLRIDRFAATMGPATPGADGATETLFSAGDIAGDNRQDVANNLMSGSAKLHLGTLTLLGETLGPIDFDYGLSRLDTSGWRSLIDSSYSPVLKGCTVPLSQQDPQEKMAETMAALKGLLPKDPEFHIDRLAITWGGKQISVKGTVHLPGVTPADLHAPDPSALIQKVDASGEVRLDDGFVGVVADAAARRSVLAAHKASAAQAAIPPELFQRMAEAKTEAEQQAALAAITRAQAKAGAGVTDAKLLADPAVLAEIKSTADDNRQKAQATRDKLLAAGVLVRDGTQLVARGAFSNGQPTINGKSPDSFKAALGDDASAPEAAAAETPDAKPAHP